MFMSKFRRIKRNIITSAIKTSITIIITFSRFSFRTEDEYFSRLTSCFFDFISLNLLTSFQEKNFEKKSFSKIYLYWVKSVQFMIVFVWKHIFYFLIWRETIALTGFDSDSTHSHQSSLLSLLVLIAYAWYVLDKKYKEFLFNLSMDGVRVISFITSRNLYPHFKYTSMVQINFYPSQASGWDCCLVRVWWLLLFCFGDSFKVWSVDSRRRTHKYYYKLWLSWDVILSALTLVGIYWRGIFYTNSFHYFVFPFKAIV